MKLELDVNEINMILKVLSKHPFEEVYTLISKIKKQGDEQIAESQKEETTNSENTEEVKD